MATKLTPEEVKARIAALEDTGGRDSTWFGDLRQNIASLPPWVLFVFYQVVVNGLALASYYGLAETLLPHMTTQGVTSWAIGTLLPLLLGLYVQQGQAVYTATTGAITAVFDRALSVAIIYSNDAHVVAVLDFLDNAEQDFIESAHDRKTITASSFSCSLMNLYKKIAGKEPSDGASDKPIDIVQNIVSDKAPINAFAYEPVPYSLVAIIWAVLLYVCVIIIPFHTVQQYGTTTPLYIVTACFLFTTVMWYGSETNNSVTGARMDKKWSRVRRHLSAQKKRTEREIYSLVTHGKASQGAKMQDMQAINMMRFRGFSTRPFSS